MIPIPTIAERMSGCWGQSYIDQLAAQKKAEAEAALLARRIKWGLSTARPWGDKDVEAANRAMRRATKG